MSRSHSMSRSQTVHRKKPQPIDDLLGTLTANEIEHLSSESFRQEEFLENYLKGPHAAEYDGLRKLKGKFSDATEIADKGLKRSVFQNYSDFIIIAKELSKIETEILELKELFQEWSTIPDSLDIQWSDERSNATMSVAGMLGSQNSGVSGAASRNSIADLSSLYRAQLQALWDGVENSQKLIPYIPGRHVVAQSSAFIELQPGTHKPRQVVSLFLLNDVLLIATKKSKAALSLGSNRESTLVDNDNNGLQDATIGKKSNAKLIADRVFPLNEVVVLDLKDNGDIRNAFQIKRNKEHIVFCTDKPDEKRALLAAFRKVAEELINKRRREKEQQQDANILPASTSNGNLSSIVASAAAPGSTEGGLTFATGSNISSIATSLANLEFASAPPSMSHMKPAQILGLSSESNKGLSWIGDLSDELTMAIASRMYDKAVTFYEKGRSMAPYLESDPQAHYLLTTQLDQLAESLVAALLRDLSQPSQTKQGIVRTTGWLMQLKQADRARETFLKMRGDVAKARARQIEFEGDTVSYISKLALVYFTCIKNTCDWYLAAFEDGRMASGFVKWASAQMEVFAELFRRQVYGVEQSDRVVKEALRVTQAHGIMLRDVGLDFGFLLQSLLRPGK